MRVPGTPGRKIDNPLSPTFREEQILEKHEELTEKEQAKDLVRITKDISCYTVLTSFAENQDKSPGGEVRATRSKLQLQSHRSRHAFNDIYNLQRYKTSPNEE